MTRNNRNAGIGKPLILSLIFIMVFVVSATSMVQAATELAIPPMTNVGGSPMGIAYDSGKGEIFVANQNDGTVSILSDSNNTVVATVTVGEYPTGVAYDSGKGEIFVANQNDGTVSILSDSNNTVVATVTMGEYPTGVAYDSGKGEIFVANTNYDSGGAIGNVSVISDSTNSVITDITVGVAPLYLVYDSGKGEIFVSNEESTGNTISVISDSTIRLSRQ